MFDELQIICPKCGAINKSHTDVSWMNPKWIKFSVSLDLCWNCHCPFEWEISRSEVSKGCKIVRGKFKS